MAEIDVELPEGWTGPVTRAVVIGVSRYPSVDGPEATERGRGSGLRSLTGAARSAAAVALWLLDEHDDPHAPLGSLTVLLSPTPGELDDTVVARLGPPTPATRDAAAAALTGLYDACVDHRDDRVFVFVAGHGAQVTTSDVTLLLEDFGAGPRSRKHLAAGVDLKEVHAAFQDDALPRRQAWFVDACREPSTATWEYAEMSAPALFDIRRRGVVDSSPLYLSASTGTAAYSSVGGLTFFTEVLLDGFRGAAAAPSSDAVGDWVVTVSSLGTHLAEEVRSRAAARGREQLVEVTGKANPAVLHHLPEPPQVVLRVELTPDAAHRLSAASLYGDRAVRLRGPCRTWPAEWTVAAGLYTLKVDTAPPYESIPFQPLSLVPPRHVAPVSVEAR